MLSMYNTSSTQYRTVHCARRTFLNVFLSQTDAYLLYCNTTLFSYAHGPYTHADPVAFSETVTIISRPSISVISQRRVQGIRRVYYDDVSIRPDTARIILLNIKRSPAVLKNRPSIRNNTQVPAYTHTQFYYGGQKYCYIPTKPVPIPRYYNVRVQLHILLFFYLNTYLPYIMLYVQRYLLYWHRPITRNTAVSAV